MKLGLGFCQTFYLEFGKMCMKLFSYFICHHLITYAVYYSEKYNLAAFFNIISIGILTLIFYEVIYGLYINLLRHLNCRIAITINPKQNGFHSAIMVMEGNNEM